MRVSTLPQTPRYAGATPVPRRKATSAPLHTMERPAPDPRPAAEHSTDPQVTDSHRTDQEERNARMVALLAAARSAPEEQRRRVIQRVVTEYLDVAEAVANRYRSRPQDHGDVRQVAYLGLVKAVQRFDPSRGGDIVSFAVPTIAGEIKRYFRDSSWMVRPPRALQELDAELRSTVAVLAQRLGREPTIDEVAAETGFPRRQVAEGLQCAHARQPVSLDGPCRIQADTDTATLGETLSAPEDDFSRADRLVAIAQACRGLSTRDRKILRMRFVQDCTQDEIARACDVTQMQISRLLTRILRDLRAQLSPELLAA